MKHATLPSLAAQNALKKLGADICAARKRRKMTQSRLADGAGVSLPTIRRLENGDEGVSMATLVMVFLVLGEVQRLANLLDAGSDDVGLMLESQNLPKRIRVPREARLIAPKSDQGFPGQPPCRSEDDIGEVF